MKIFSYGWLKLFDLNGCNKLYINPMIDHPLIGIFDVPSIFANWSIKLFWMFKVKKQRTSGLLEPVTSYAETILNWSWQLVVGQVWKGWSLWMAKFGASNMNNLYPTCFKQQITVEPLNLFLKKKIWKKKILRVKLQGNLS